MIKGYIAAAVTVMIWGLTFVFTKTLLVSFTPVEILISRFIIGMTALFVAAPRRLKTKGWQEEKYLLLAALTGIFLYYFLENVSLLWTSASNAGVIVSTAPFFTALISDEKKTRNFFIGFAVAIIGIVMISFSSLEFSAEGLIGDGLALLAAFVWAFYAVASKKIAQFGYSPLLTVRRTFIYGILFMIIPLILWNRAGEDRVIFSSGNITGLLFLGLMASALCFVLWNFALTRLGPVCVSQYIYLIPLVTVGTSLLVLGEPVTLLAVLGMALILAGLTISEGRFRIRKR